MSQSTSAPALTTHTRNRLLALVGVLAMLVPSLIFTPWAEAAANPAASIDQWANSAARWQNGNLNQNNSVWLEGEAVPFRAILTDLDTYDADPDAPGNQHTITIGWDNFDSGAHAYDYLVSYDYSAGVAPGLDPCVASPVVAGCNAWATSTAPIPADPNAPTGLPSGQVMTLVGGVLDGNATYGGVGTDSTTLTYTFTTTQPTAVLVWAGHLAEEADWPGELTAADIGGSPFHQRVVDLDGKAGSQDRSMKAEAVLTPDIDVVKTANPSAAYPGTVVTYTYVVSNPGEIDLTGVTLVDDKLGAITLGTTTLTKGGGTTTATATYTLLAADVASSPVVNTATATGNWAQLNRTGTVTATDTASVAVHSPTITVAKTGSRTTATSAGDTVVYGFTVTNTGNVTLTNVSATDTDLGALTLGSTTLAPGESTTATAVAADRTYAITQADVDAGSHVNTATATGSPPNGADVSDTDTWSVAIASIPGLSVEKTGSTTVATGAGDQVTYTFAVTNTGNVTLTDVSATDTDFGVLTLDTTSLAPGAVANATGTYTYTVTQTDADAGAHTNVVTASATAPDESSVGPATDTWTVDILAAPSITVDKTPGSVSAGIGDTVTYTYVVTNTGNVTLTDVTLVDDLLGPVIVPGVSALVDLAPGESRTFQATTSIVEGDLPGPVVNVATTTGTPPDGAVVRGTDDASVDLVTEPGIEVVKSANVTSASPGDVIEYTYVITNTGDLTLTNVDLQDDVLGAIIGLAGASALTLAPGESVTTVVRQTVTEADLPGPLVNTAIVTGTPPVGPDVDDEAVESVDLTGNPAIEVVKNAEIEPNFSGLKLVAFEPNDADDETVAYTYVVTNTGDVTLTGVTLVDDVLGTVTLADTTLAPGASTTGTATHVVTQTDADTGEIVNVAVVSGTAPDGSVVDGRDTETVNVTVVLPTVIERPDDPAPAPAPDPIAPTDLPRTGFDSDALAMVAFGMLALGVLLLTVEARQRRRREGWSV